MSRYDENNRNDMPMFAHVTVGILIATLIITTAGGALIYLNWKAQEQQILLIAEERNRPMKEAAAERERERQAAIAIAEASAKAQIDARRIVMEESEKATREMAAFKRWYKKPEKCQIMSDHDTRMFCANDYIRASRKWKEIKEKKLY